MLSEFRCELSQSGPHYLAYSASKELISVDVVPEVQISTRQTRCVRTNLGSRSTSSILGLHNIAVEIAGVLAESGP